MGHFAATKVATAAVFCALQQRWTVPTPRVHSEIAYLSALKIFEPLTSIQVGCGACARLPGDALVVAWWSIAISIISDLPE